jgi:hypothetical protein
MDKNYNFIETNESYSIDVRKLKYIPLNEHNRYFKDWKNHDYHEILLFGTI